MATAAVSKTAEAHKALKSSTLFQSASKEDQMLVTITDRKDGLPSVSFDAVPECGDHCDRCGDCLLCFGDDRCTGESRAHLWIVYADLEPERAAELLTGS